jgi:hypothetical protein
MNKFSQIHRFFTRLFIIFLCLLATQSCQRYQALPNALDEYSERMYNVLDIDKKVNQRPSTLAFPDKSTLAIQIPPLNIKMREFYSIDDCALKQLIAQRNTALGKVQLPSVRLQYEWQLIERMRKCLEKNSNSLPAPMIDKMSDWLAQKEAIYPLNWANMISQSTEVHLGFSSSSGFIDGNEKDNFTQALFDLKNLLGMKNAPEANIAEMEASLQSMQQHRLYARLWRSQMLMTNYLDDMTVDISKWATGFSCSTRKDKEKLEIIRNVFNAFFVQKIQTIGSQINHYHYSLKPEILALSKDSHLPNNLKLTLNKYNKTSFEKYKESMLSHIKMWQTIFKKCDK